MSLPPLSIVAVLRALLAARVDGIEVPRWRRRLMLESAAEQASLWTPNMSTDVSKQGTHSTTLDGNESEVVGIIVTRWIQENGKMAIDGKSGERVDVLAVAERLLA